MSIFDTPFMDPAIPLPKKFHEVITDATFVFPTDYPHVAGFSPDATRTLK